MSEEITNSVADTTQVADDTANEANNVDEQITQSETTNSEGVVENSNDDTVDEDGVQSKEEGQVTDQSKQPNLEELQAKLKEYEVRDEEDRMIREKLGISDVDQQTYNLMNIDQQIVNEGKQVYLRLCNKYGIDANPEKIDASVEELKKTDPAKAYEFQREFEKLGDEVDYKRGMVQQQNAIYEVNKFSNDYGEILNASPALTNIMTQYIESYGGGNGMYQQLQNVLNTIMPAYQEAFNAGRQFALQDKAKKDTSGVSGGVATANTQTYTPGNVFTREQIAKMSTEEFAKYEKEIQRQMIEGKII